MVTWFFLHIYVLNLMILVSFLFTDVKKTDTSETVHCEIVSGNAWNMRVCKVIKARIKRRYQAYHQGDSLYLSGPLPPYPPF